MVTMDGDNLARCKMEHPFVKNVVGPRNDIDNVRNPGLMKYMIKNDLNKGLGKFSIVSIDDGRSQVWNKFHRILDKETGNVVDFVMCQRCKEVYSFHFPSKKKLSIWKLRNTQQFTLSCWCGPNWLATVKKDKSPSILK